MLTPKMFQLIFFHEIIQIIWIFLTLCRHNPTNQKKYLKPKFNLEVCSIAIIL